METVKVSPKFQVVIPREVRKAMNLRAGQRVRVFQYDNRIELVPVRDIRSLKGFLKGMDTDVPRESDRV